MLVIGHTATRWALDHLLDGRPLEDVVARPFDWREGWEYNVEAHGVAAGRPASGTLLWDVDTQVDFVRSDGKLAVPDAESVAPAMARLVRWAADSGVTHLATADDHELTDPEISHEPDFESTYPPHCLRGTPGASRIPETAQVDPLPLR